MCDLFDEQVFETKYRRLVHGHQKRFGDLLKHDPEAEIANYKVKFIWHSYFPNYIYLN